MKTVIQAQAQLNFIFTPEGFYVDRPEGEWDHESAMWAAHFQEDCYQALYRFGLGERMKK